MHPELDPRTYISAETSARIGSAIKAITESYKDHLEFMAALRDVPGTHGIRDIYVASESITYREQGPSTLNLAVIVETEPNISQEDARSWVMSALDGYSGTGRRITYDFTTFDSRPAGALASVTDTRNQHERVRTTDEFLDALTR